MNIFNWNERNGTASLAKQRLQGILPKERNLNVGYLDDLQKDIVILMQRYTHSTDIETIAYANKNNTIDIKIIINN